MSLNPKRSPQKRDTESVLSLDEIGYLLDGDETGKIRWLHPTNHELLTMIWQGCMSARIMPTWIKENPCTRPFSWWTFDAPEPRRRLDGKATTPHFDLPGHWIKKYDAANYETQYSYLKRLGLLTEAELAPCTDFEKIQSNDNIDLNLKARRKKYGAPEPKQYPAGYLTDLKNRIREARNFEISKYL